MSAENNIQAAIDAGRMLNQVQNIPLAGAMVPVVIRPDGTVIYAQLAELEKFLPAPLRKRGSWAFGTVESFIRYVNQHKESDAAIFATITETGARFTSTLNFHGKVPSWNDHVATHALTPTVEWQRWLGANGKRMTQAEFATFLEENSDLFITPSGADMLELVQSLEGHSNVAFNSGIKLQNGAIKLSYDEEVTLKGQVASVPGSLEVPKLLEAGIEPFNGTGKVKVAARLKYRIESRKVSLWFETIDAHKIVRDICDSIIAQITEKTGIQPFIV